MVYFLTQNLHRLVYRGIGKEQTRHRETTKFSAFLTEYCPRLAVTNTFTKIGSIFRNEFNPSGSEGVLDHSPCVSPEDVDTNRQERVSKSGIWSVSPSSERKEKNSQQNMANGILAIRTLINISSLVDQKDKINLFCRASQ